WASRNRAYVLPVTVKPTNDGKFPESIFKARNVAIAFDGVIETILRCITVRVSVASAYEQIAAHSRNRTNAIAACVGEENPVGEETAAGNRSEFSGGGKNGGTLGIRVISRKTISTPRD